MPKDVAAQSKPTVPTEKDERRKVKSLIDKTCTATMEIDSFVSGAFAMFRADFSAYCALTRQEKSIQAQVEIAEKKLCLTRDFLIDNLKKTEALTTPTDFGPALACVRFVGVRLADACKTVVSEKKKVTYDQLLHALNNGGFRWRTTAPAREIHAAMLQSKRLVKKLGSEYLWIGGGEAIEMRPRVQVETRDEAALEAPSGSEAETKAS